MILKYSEKNIYENIFEKIFKINLNLKYYIKNNNELLDRFYNYYFIILYLIIVNLLQHI